MEEDYNPREHRMRVKERGMENAISRRGLKGEDAEAYRQAQRELWQVEEELSALTQKAVGLLPKAEQARFSDLEVRQTGLEGVLISPKPKELYLMLDSDELPEPPPA